MTASSSTCLSPRLAIVLLLAMGFGQSASAQEPDGASRFVPTFGPPASPDEVAALEQRAFEALNGLFGRTIAISAIPELMEAAYRGSAAAMAQLGSMHQEGSGVIPRDTELAMHYMVAAAERGNFMGQVFNGGRFLYGRGVQSDPEQARAWFEAAANQGDPVAMHTLALMYATGMGVEADNATRFELLSRSAALGHLDSLRAVGLEFLQSATRRDPARGMAILEQAAERDAGVAYLVGYQYLIGTVAARDVVRGAQWISAAAEQGYPEAQVMLADLQEQGIGVARDPERAQRSRAAVIASSSPEDRNGFAWRYAVSPEGTLRNGQLAVEIMESLLASPEMVNAARLDTLAAAYAEVGRFEDAVATQQAAIDRVIAQGGAASPSDLVLEIRLPELRARLEGYRSGQPYRTAF